MSGRYMFLNTILIVTLISFQLKSQNFIASINSYEIEDENVLERFVVEVGLKNGEEIVFSFRSPRPLIHDAYADSNFCTIVFEDATSFMVSAAFKDTIENKWVIDYSSTRMYKNDPKTSNIAWVYFYDIKILNENTLEINYALEVLSEGFKKRYHGDLNFPRTSKCILTPSYIYNQEIKRGVALNGIRIPNSPRLRLE